MQHLIPWSVHCDPQGQPHQHRPRQACPGLWAPSVLEATRPGPDGQQALRPPGTTLTWRLELTDPAIPAPHLYLEQQLGTLGQRGRPAVLLIAGNHVALCPLQHMSTNNGEEGRNFKWGEEEELSGRQVTCQGPGKAFLEWRGVGCCKEKRCDEDARKTQIWRTRGF